MAWKKSHLVILAQEMAQTKMHIFKQRQLCVGLGQAELF